MRFAELVNAAAERHGVAPALVAGVIAAESAFNPQAYRAEPKINDASRGLMQLLLGTARRLGYMGSPLGLYDPATNIDLGTRLLRSNFDTALSASRARGQQLDARELWARALSAYNAGFSTVRPGDAKRDTGGRFINQDYVDRVRRWAERFASGADAALGGPALGWLAILTIAAVAFRYGRHVPSSFS